MRTSLVPHVHDAQSRRFGHSSSSRFRCFKRFQRFRQRPLANVMPRMATAGRTLCALVLACGMMIPVTPAYADPQQDAEGNVPAAPAAASTNNASNDGSAAANSEPLASSESDSVMGKPVNDGTYLVEVEDKSAESGANLMGFDTSRAGTESEEYGTVDPAKGWVGVVPGEVISLMKGGVADGYDLVNRDGTGNFGYGVIWQNGSPYIENSATAAVDINHDGADEFVYLSESGEIKLYNVMTTATFTPWWDPPLIRLSLDGKRYADTGGASTFNRDACSMLMQGPNICNLKTGDLDGNGCDDIVVFYYGEDGPRLEVFFLFHGKGDLYLTGTSGSDWPSGLTGYSLISSMSGYEVVDHQSIDLPRMLDGAYYGHLPASLEVADLTGDGNDDIVVAYQEGNPTSGPYRTNLAVYHAEPRDEVTITIDPTFHEKATFSRSQLVGDAKPWMPHNYTSTQMTSVSVGDVDADGFAELVVGGYSGTGALDGELYLSYLEWVYASETDAVGALDRTNVHGFTRLLDDNDLHVTTGSDLYDHYHTDTSLYHQDGDSRCFSAGGTPYTLSRYVNTSNWTVPLTCVSLTGYQNNQPCDQVFFGMLMYDFDPEAGSFKLHLNTHDNRFNKCDNNNVLLLLSEATVTEDMVPGCTDDDQAMDAMLNYYGGEALFQMSLFDQDEDTGENVRVDSYIYYDEGSTTNRSWTVERHNISWDDEDFRWVPALGNFLFDNKGNDQDALFLRLVAHEFTYSEPELQSVLVAPPSFEDISALTGYDSGSTALTKIEGSTVEYGASITLGFDFSICAGLKVGKNETMLGVTPGFSVNPAYKGSQMRDVQYTVNTSKGQDSAVVACVPLDLYYYEISRAAMRPEFTSNAVDLAVMRVPGSPHVQIMPLETYDELAKNYNDELIAYNQWMKIQTNNLAKPLPSLPTRDDIVSHEKGRPETYVKQPDLDTSGLENPEDVISLDYGEDFGSSSKSLLCTWKRTDGASATLNVKAGIKFSAGTRFTDFNLGVSANASGMGGKSFHEGTAFKGELKSVPTEWSDYGMTLAMYAGKKGYGFEGEDAEYVLVGYEASQVRYGVAVPRSLTATSTESHAVTLETQLPWGAHNSSQYYVLERFDPYTNTWQAIHTFDKPNLQGGEQMLFTETFTDRGGADGSGVGPDGSSAALDPETTYHYRVSDPLHAHDVTATATTQGLAYYEVSYPEISDWGLVAARAISPTTGWKATLSDGAKVEEGSELHFFALPFEGYSLDETCWKVSETVGGQTTDITNDAARVKVVQGGTVIAVFDVQGSIKVEAQATPAEGPGPQLTLSDAWSMTLRDAEGNDVQGSVGVSPEDVKLPVAFDKVPWITDAQSIATVEAGPGVSALALLPLGGEYDATTVDRFDLASSAGSLNHNLENLPDGEYLVLAVAKMDDGSVSAQLLPVRKDALQPTLNLGCIDAPGVGGNRMIVVTPTTGPSGVSKVEIAEGKDATEGFVDVTDAWKQGVLTFGPPANKPTLRAASAQSGGSGATVAGLKPGENLENGWYTIRVTNGAGAVAADSIEVTGVTHPEGVTASNPQPQPKPDDQKPKPTPGGNENNGNNNGDDKNTSGGNQQTSGEGDGSPLAPTGDRTSTAVSAAGTTTIAAALVAAIALLMTLHRRSSNAKKQGAADRS